MEHVETSQCAWHVFSPQAEVQFPTNNLELNTEYYNWNFEWLFHVLCFNFFEGQKTNIVHLSNQKKTCYEFK